MQGSKVIFFQHLSSAFLVGAYKYGKVLLHSFFNGSSFYSVLFFFLALKEPRFSIKLQALYDCFSWKREFYQNCRYLCVVGDD